MRAFVLLSLITLFDNTFGSPFISPGRGYLHEKRHELVIDSEPLRLTGTLPKVGGGPEKSVRRRKERRSPVQANAVSNGGLVTDYQTDGGGGASRMDNAESSAQQMINEMKAKFASTSPTLGTSTLPQNNASTAQPGQCQCPGRGSGANGGFGCADPNIVGADVCGGGGCTSLQQYCAQIQQNQKTDQCCPAPGGTGTVTPSGTGAVPPGGSVVPPGGTGIQPAGTGLQPGGTAVQPGGTGLQPAGSGVPPGGTGVAPGGTGLQPGGTPANDGSGTYGTSCDGQQVALQESPYTKQQCSGNTGAEFGGSANDYLQIINKYRAAFCLPLMTQDSSLEANALQSGKTSHGSIDSQDETPCSGGGSVMAGGNPAEFELSMLIWVCEKTTNKVSKEECQKAQCAYNFAFTEIDHYEFLVGARAKDWDHVGCAFVPDDGSVPRRDGVSPQITGLWTCSLKQGGQC